MSEGTFSGVGAHLNLTRFHNLNNTFVLARFLIWCRNEVFIGWAIHHTTIINEYYFTHRKESFSMTSVFILQPSFDILWKVIFRLTSYSKWKWNVLIDRIYQEPCLFCFCALFSNYCKINLTAKNGSNIYTELCNVYSKLHFWKKKNIRN